MIWTVMCGLAEWSVQVEAGTKEEAIELGIAEFVERFQNCDSYFASSTDTSKAEGAKP